MADPRWNKLAKVLLDHSVRIEPGEVVVLTSRDVPDDMLALLIGELYSKGAVPLVNMMSDRVLRAYLKDTDEATMAMFGQSQLELYRRAKAAIFLYGPNNITELSDVPEERMRLFSKHFQGPVILDHVSNKLRWVYACWPTPAMAQSAEMSTEAFESFLFDACTMDYSRMSKAMDPLVDLMRRTDRVRLVAPGTDLEFSIKGIPVVKCDGQNNIPDGEVFTAPVKDSVEGTIRYNTRSSYHGKLYEGIRFRFKEGKIVEATSSREVDMNAILDTDEGARYVGEFAIGLNPFVRRPMLNTLFDEKIAGSIHLTPGNAYDVAPNGNRSSVHWDLVLIQTKEWGGGEMYFDGELVRKDGLFVLDELEGLNPRNLV